MPTYQIKPLLSREEKEQARRLAKATRLRRAKERKAKVQAKLDKLVAARRAYAEVIKAKLLVFDAEIAQLTERLK